MFGTPKHKVCSRCERFVRIESESCPFCQRSGKGAWKFVIPVVAGLSGQPGCGQAVDEQEEMNAEVGGFSYAAPVTPDEGISTALDGTSDDATSDTSGGDGDGDGGDGDGPGDGDGDGDSGDGDGDG